MEAWRGQNRTGWRQGDDQTRQDRDKENTGPVRIGQDRDKVQVKMKTYQDRMRTVRG